MVQEVAWSAPATSRMLPNGPWCQPRGPPLAAQFIEHSGLHAVLGELGYGDNLDADRVVGATGSCVPGSKGCPAYDRVGHGHVPALKCAIGSFGADRLLLGTDFPNENGNTFLRAIGYINDPQIGADAARVILDQNASALLGIG